ncbi:MAG: NHLP bacteriocin system secretion protein [Bryobacteraceae bacterium]|nr:NHLP bacteriocin system secretion protein [Bryobacteraceae bacterium]
MNTDIFRKVSLARLSSPEQLDQLLRVVTIRSWIALAALMILVGVAVVWGYQGIIATRASGQGVVIRSGGVLNVASLGAGQVMQLYPKVGDHVSANQVVAVVAQPSLVEQIRIAKARRSDAIREREELRRVRDGAVKLQLESIAKQRANTEQEIRDLEEQAKLAREQIPVDEQLFSKGLITRQQVIVARQKLVQIQSSIERLRTQIVQLEATRFQTETHGLEDDVRLEARIMDLERNLEALEKETTAASRIVSPYSGQVLELKVGVGNLVDVGTALLSVQPDVRELEVVAYIPADIAKQVQPGMKAEISPSMVRREEHGYIRGSVVQVADYPATEAALMRIFENAPLARALASAGPVTELRLRMEEDPSTPSGFRWSSPQGAPVKISGGTICSVRIVTREDPPVKLVFPFLKEKLGLS